MVNIKNELFKYFIHFFEENAINYKKTFNIRELFPISIIPHINIWYYENIKS